VLAQVQKGLLENLTDSWMLLTEEKPDIFRQKKRVDEFFHGLIDLGASRRCGFLIAAKASP